jgi:hypothetical protein
MKIATLATPFRRLLALIALAVPLSASAALEPGFAPLDPSGKLDAYEMIATPAETWKVEADMVACTGDPRGYILTKKSYRNFILRLDIRFAHPDGLTDESAFPGNSGVLLHVSGERKVWPACVEVQGKHVDTGRIIGIGGAPRVTATDDAAARKRVLQPVGEWNSLDIVSIDGAVSATLNGVLVCVSEAGPLREGPIGFQSEGSPVAFRNIRILELP